MQIFNTLSICSIFSFRKLNRCSSKIVVLVLLIFSCADLPTNPNNVSNSSVNICLKTTTWFTAGQEVYDTVGNSVEVIFVLTYPKFITFVTLQIMATNGLVELDTSLSSVSKSNYDTIHLTQNITKAGDKKVIATAHRNDGSTRSDTAYMHIMDRVNSYTKYSVTYVGNGNTSGSSPIDSVNYETGATVLVKGGGTLLKTGSTFAGWNTSSDGTGISYSIGVPLVVGVSNVILYAMWTKDSYSITYNLAGGVNGNNPESYDVTSATITLVNPTKTGYTFAGWFTNEGFTTEAKSIPAGSTGNKEFWAKWVIITYDITYNNVENSKNDNNPNSYKITSSTITLVDPVKTGYTFGGWFSNVELTTAIASIPAGSIGNKEFWAKWMLNTFTVSFNSNGGTIVTSQSVVNNAVAIAPTTPNRPGYIFANWYADSTFSTIFNFTTPISAAITLYAKWIPNVYTITFDGQGATTAPNPATKSITVPATKLDALPTPPKKTSYVFAGWWTGINGGGKAFTTDTVISANDTVYAKWEIRDIDGNVYTEVTIGDQVWMVENLRVRKFNDGESIIYGGTESDALQTTPRYCYYNNTANIDSIKKYGALYNWYTVNTKKLAPSGWHVPEVTDWNILETYLILNGFNYDGSRTSNLIAKSLATKTDWKASENEGAIGNDLTTNNKSGFSAFPSGMFSSDGTFYGMTSTSCSASFWCATESDSLNAFNRDLDFEVPYLIRSTTGNNKGCAYSVRLIRD